MAPLFISLEGAIDGLERPQTLRHVKLGLFGHLAGLLQWAYRAIPPLVVKEEAVVVVNAAAGMDLPQVGAF